MDNTYEDIFGVPENPEAKRVQDEKHINGEAWMRAIDNMARGHRDEASIKIICDAVSALIRTDDGMDDSSCVTRLWDWIADGAYDGTESAESLAREWDTLTPDDDPDGNVWPQ